MKKVIFHFSDPTQVAIERAVIASPNRHNEKLPGYCCKSPVKGFFTGFGETPLAAVIDYREINGLKLAKLTVKFNL